MGPGLVAGRGSSSISARARRTRSGLRSATSVLDFCNDGSCSLLRGPMVYDSEISRNISGIAGMLTTSKFSSEVKIVNLLQQCSESFQRSHHGCLRRTVRRRPRSFPGSIHEVFETLELAANLHKMLKDLSQNTLRMKTIAILIAK